MLNTQRIEKPRGGTEKLEVNSVFYTVQAEGPLAGTPAVFVRLAGCNLQCPACDTEYTRRQELSVESICGIARHMGGKSLRLVVITGGEPFRQDIGLLVSELRSRDLMVQIETNGVLWREISPDAIIVCSPKTSQVHETIEARAAAYKYVLTAGEVAEDGLPQRVLGLGKVNRVARPPERLVRAHQVYVQGAGEGEGFEPASANGLAALESAKQHGYKLSVQWHKAVPKIDDDGWFA